MSESAISAFKAEVLAELDNIPVPDLSELEADLSEYYIQADQADKSQYNLNGLAPVAANFGGSIFEKIRKFVCSILSADSTAQDIIDAILDAVSSIIPGGVFIGWIVKKAIRYILNLGYQALCPVI